MRWGNMTQSKLRDGHLRDRIVSNIFEKAEKISEVVVKKEQKVRDWDRMIDNVLTSKYTGYPIMIFLLGVVFWLTITGANYPSQLLATGLFWIEERLIDLFALINTPHWLNGVLMLEYIEPLHG